MKWKKNVASENEFIKMDVFDAAMQLIMNFVRHSNEEELKAIELCR